MLILTAGSVMIAKTKMVYKFFIFNVKSSRSYQQRQTVSESQSRDVWVLKL